MTDRNELFAGKTALVTGAGRGLGRELALAFARAGANVVGTARTQAQVEDTVEEIRGMGRHALPIIADVTQEEQVLAMTNQALDEFGVIDILINNAGMAVYGPFVEQDAMTGGP